MYTMHRYADLSFAFSKERDKKRHLPSSAILYNQLHSCGAAKKSLNPPVIMTLVWWVPWVATEPNIYDYNFVHVKKKLLWSKRSE